jgi:Caspase domain
MTSSDRDVAQPTGKKVAIAIGVEHSSINGLPPLQGPRKDVSLLRNVLESPDIGRFDLFVSIDDPLYDDADVKRKVKNILDEVSPIDFLLFYFSGHADLTTSGQFRLVLAGTTDPDVDGLDVTAIVALARARGIQQMLFILDCCYAGAAAGNLVVGGGQKAGHSDYMSALIGAAGPSAIAKINLATLASYMTEAIHEGMTTSDADLDGDGTITVEEIWQYCQRKLEGRELRLWRSFDGNANTALAQARQRPTSKDKSSPIPNSDYQIYSRWEPGRVLDSVRGARGNVSILQTWFPGGESEVARYGFARSDVQYQMLLLAPGSNFVAYRIANREDFAFTFVELRSNRPEDQVAAMEDKRRRSLAWLWRNQFGPYTWLYDSFIPGPIYVIDHLVYYGIFLPQTDSALGPMHRAPLESDMGQLLLQEIGSLTKWGHPSSAPRTPPPLLDEEVSLRMERLELAVAWLQHPANTSGAPPFELLEDAQVIDRWGIEELCEQIKNARTRVFMYQEWAADSDCTIGPEAIPRRVDGRLVTNAPEGEFLRLRSTLLCGGHAELFEEALATAKEYARNCIVAMKRARGPELRINVDTFMPINVCVIDDRVFYTLALTAPDPWRAPVHVVRADSAPGAAILSAFGVVWRRAQPGAGY